MAMHSSALRDLLTRDQSTQSRELLLQSPDLAAARPTSGLFAALFKAGEPLCTVAFIASTGTSDITCRPREATVLIRALSGEGVLLMPHHPRAPSRTD